MIKLLKEEQTSDEKTRDFCDEEFRTNAGETKSTTQKISSLTAEISASESSIAEAQELVAKKQTEVAELKKSMQEATEQRKQENAEFIEMQQLNHSAVQLINKAMNKLNKFYNPGQYKAPEDRELTDEERVLRGAGQDIGDTTAKTAIAGTSQTTTVSFLQKIAGNNKAPTLPAAPETYGEHKAKGQKSNSVITLLKNLINDLEKETQAAEHAEKTAQRDYETLSTDAAKQQAECETMIADTTGAIANEEEKLNAATVNKQAQEATLAELQDQKTQLHKECDFIVAHFEERREAREKEIDGLTSAKSILSGANFS
jgi:chromosome segregation ATPase